MNSSTTISPLRQRMIEDMRMRKLAPHTQVRYIRAVRKFARYLNRSPDTATAEDLRNFQLYLVDHGASPITLSATITGLKFFFGVTLDRGALIAKMQHVFVPRTLPVILSREEVRLLIAAAPLLEVPGSALGGVRGGTARERGSGAEGDRRRQQTHGAAHRARQGRQRSLRDALPGDARAASHLVSGGPRSGQDARRRLEHDFTVAWRSQPKWVVSRSLKSVGPHTALVEDDIEAVIRGLKAQPVGRIEVA
jgi:Phage integrase, N-terminal SAM-like domain